MTYDPIGRLVATRDPAGYETRMNYCAELAQQPCAIVDALGNVTTVVEDELGRETERRDPLGNVVRTGYDNLGRRTSVTDPAGKQTRFEYDVIGRLTKVIDAAGGETVYGYDGRGNRTRVEDANRNADHLRLRRRQPAVPGDHPDHHGDRVRLRPGRQPHAQAGRQGPDHRLRLRREPPPDRHQLRRRA